MNVLIRILLLFLAFALSESPSLADEDWVITVTTNSLNNYMNYAGSNMQPFVKASISYVQVKKEETKSGDYQDLYYGNFNSVGCLRKNLLDLTPGTEGEIQLKSTAKNISKNEAYAGANAVARLLIDLNLKRCRVKWVKAPYDSFDTVIEGFIKAGFHLDDPGGANDNTARIIILSVLSEPAGLSQHVIF